MNPRHLLVLILILLVPSIIILWVYGLIALLFAIPWALLLIGLTNMDKVFSAIASFYELSSSISFWFEKNAVEKRLESTIRTTAKKVNQEAGALLPHGIDIKWVKPMDRDAFLKQGKVVVCLEPSSSQDRNLARATMLFVETDLIRESQRYVDPVVMKSTKFVISRKMMLFDRRYDAIRCLNEEFIEPAIKNESQIGEFVLALAAIDDNGLLTRVLLREYTKLDAKLFSKSSPRKSFKETRALANMLKVFVERDREEDVPLQMKGQVIRVGLAPVARASTGFCFPVYISRTLKSHKAQIEAVYVMAMGWNIKYARIVVNAMERKGLYNKCKDWEFKGFRGEKRADMYVAEMTISSGETAVLEAFQTLHDIVESMCSKKKYTGLEAVANEVRNAGIDYVHLGFKKFGAFIEAAETRHYIRTITENGQSKVVKPVQQSTTNNEID